MHFFVSGGHHSDVVFASRRIHKPKLVSDTDCYCLHAMYVCTVMILIVGDDGVACAAGRAV